MSPRKTLDAFILEKISDVPLARRILLYRCMAIETDDKALAKECRKQADALETADREHQQLILDFCARSHATD